MNIVLIGSCLLATAMLLGACQATSPTGPSRSVSFEQHPDGGPDVKRNRCCRRATRSD